MAMRAMVLALALGLAAGSASFDEELVQCNVAGTSLDTEVTVKCCEFLFGSLLVDLRDGAAVRDFMVDSDDNLKMACSRNRYTHCLDALQELVDLAGGLDTDSEILEAGDLDTVADLCPVDGATCCSAGERHVDGTVCCPTDCDICGGPMCAAYAPGASQCCKSELELADQVCGSVLDTSCVCPSSGRDSVRRVLADVYDPAEDELEEELMTLPLGN